MPLSFFAGVPNTCDIAPTKIGVDALIFWLASSCALPGSPGFIPALNGVVKAGFLSGLFVPSRRGVKPSDFLVGDTKEELGLADTDEKAAFKGVVNDGGLKPVDEVERFGLRGELCDGVEDGPATGLVSSGDLKGFLLPKGLANAEDGRLNSVRTGVGVTGTSGCELEGWAEFSTSLRTALPKEG